MWRSGMLAVLALVALAALVPAVTAANDVLELDPSSFKAMLKSDEIYVTAFTAPWCGHCQRLKPEYQKAAAALKGIVKFANVDMTQHQSLGGPYNVQGFPTIKIFGADKQHPSDFNSQRTAKALVDAALNEVRAVANARMGGKSSGRSSGSGSRSGSGSGGKNVIEASGSSFGSDVLGTEDLVIVAFTAPWCGHCQRLHPEYEKAARELKNEPVRFVNVDATQEQSLAAQYGVQGYPTIKVFPAGPKSGETEDYPAGRSASDFVEYAKSKLLETKPAPEVVEIADNSAFASSCTDHQLCFITFVPDILDTKAEGRNALIELQKDMAEKYKRRPFGWVWAAAGTQPALEAALDVGGFGYPALVAVNAKKERFATMRGAYTEDSISDFVGRLLTGRQATANLPGMPTVEKVEPWDGSDGPEEAFEEEFDLSDLDDVELDDGKDEL